MSAIGDIEKKTQNRVVKLFRDKLGYAYLGDWAGRDGNSNVETELLQKFLAKKYDDGLITKALQQFQKAAGNSTQSLYDRNKAVYQLLRYGVKVSPGPGEAVKTVWLIDWRHPSKNHFAIAEEVTVPAANPKAATKRPDIVLYVNGIALCVLELKRSTVSISEGIRQNLDNQTKEFIQPFFSTMQFVFAGSDTQGLRYGTIGTTERYYLTWKEEGGEGNPLDRALAQLCEKGRFLELIYDFTVFDAGVKKLCRTNQYFGVRAAQPFVKRHEGGIIWHTQGSGKSLTMVWLAKWIRENVENPRVLIITDRTELDEQIEKVFRGVNETIYRTKSGADLVTALGMSTHWLLCSLVHKFGLRGDDGDTEDAGGYLDALRSALPHAFRPQGNIFVFVDECHRTQSGALHDAMKELLPEAVFIGFTGTPLLKSDKQRSIEVFGRYIHTYKFNEAVRDGVVLDLRYEARDIDQNITSQSKIDQWFEAKTKGLTLLARAQLKQRWGTLRKVLSSQSRLEKIVADILMDMETKDRLASGHGNAMLVTGSIYEACKVYELFAKTDLKGKCAIITSYRPIAASIKGEETGEGLTEKLRQYEIYRQMLAGWFDEPAEEAVNKADLFEKQVKRKFIEEPGQMKLLIVVDKLLTGFDAPPATYLYIDKQMQDHGLFQAICRVNRLDGDDKEYGYVIDYKDLFRSLEGAFNDYTSGALDGYDKEDVAGLLEDRLKKARERLDDALEAIRELCAPVAPPKAQDDFFAFFSSAEHGNELQRKGSEPRRLKLYTLTSALIRAYADIANEMVDARYSPAEAAAIKAEVTFYENLRNEVKHHSGDAIDLKLYEPAMRHLIDTYIRAEESQQVTTFDDLSLVQLLVEQGTKAVGALPAGIQKSEKAVAETIENNIRKLIVDEQPINPKYYEKMSALLDALIAQRKADAVEYKDYLEKLVALTRQAKHPETAGGYPTSANTPARRALYDNLAKDEKKALAVDAAIHAARQDAWRENTVKVRRVRNAIHAVLLDDVLTDGILEIATNQHEY